MIEERDAFMSLVEVVGECWLWKGATNSDGYGMLRFRGKKDGAHRVAYTLFRGEIAPRMFVCHTCDIPCCVNPDHLWVGTHAENMRDMVAKGRHNAAIRAKARSSRGRRGSITMESQRKDAISKARRTFQDEAASARSSLRDRGHHGPLEVLDRAASGSRSVAAPTQLTRLALELKDAGCSREEVSERMRRVAEMIVELVYPDKQAA